MKKTVVLVMILVFAFSSIAIIQADNIRNTSKAEELKLLGLVQGTGNGYNLDKTFTRAEGAVMIIRLSGAEKEALAYKEKSIFTDVSGSYWAVNYISYAYKNNLVKGVSGQKYSPDTLMTGAQFITLVLRTLGYREASPETAFPLAVQSGLLSLKRAEELTKKDTFLRDDMIEVTYNSLCTIVKGSPKTLLQKLVEDKMVIDKQIALKSGLYVESSLMDKIDDAISEELKKASNSGK